MEPANDARHNGLWSLKEIMAYGKWSRTTAYKIISQPGFPKPRREAGTHPRWCARDIREYFERAA
jgi:predicted DNA-binding transcriptional regulator AlpA